HSRLVLLVTLGIAEEGNDRRHLGGAGALKGVDPEEQLHEVVVNRLFGPLDDKHVAAANIFQDAGEHVSFAEYFFFRPCQLDPELLADRPRQSLACRAGKYLQLAKRIRQLRGRVATDKRLVHAPFSPSDRTESVLRRSDHLPDSQYLNEPGPRSPA